MLPGKKASKFMPTDVYRGAEAPTKGAKRGGLTDHLSGMHLIPNVGREAMVPGECVRRQPRAKPKPKPEPVKPKWEPQKKKKAHHRDRSRERGRSRSKERRRQSSSSSADEDEHRDREEVYSKIDIEQDRKQEELRRREEQAEKELQVRLEQEQKKLKELEEVRQKNQAMQSTRKQKLHGLFALTEDDIEAEENDDAKRARIAKERARVERKAASAPERSRVNYDAPMSVAESVLSSATSSGALAQEVAGNLTAADLDGRLHDHKFSKVWKDWDANKKSDPGEIARQFMKIAAIKRRGYAAGGGVETPQNMEDHSSRGGRGRALEDHRGQRQDHRGHSRSRSRGRGRYR